MLQGPSNVDEKQTMGPEENGLYSGSKQDLQDKVRSTNKASQIFYNEWGVKTIEVYIVTCRGRQAMPTWKRLEAALIHAFWNIHH